ncbi:lytic transglycosylase domain-containing protein [Amycolatopsis aidingensis]|uniref:lytic transglycosylase domain-containing protein n=1 Tax=Amycolatopsis aidingensis TaxID=2842453 RepID=UPI001E63B4BB|nr:lytic transglycosylase domain-containing protein [Amycolatopsis aidingensis]
MKIAIAAVAAIIAVPILIGGIGQAIVKAIFGSGSTQPSQEALADIPADYLALYQAAAPVCPGLDWSILAAIGKIETDHGRLRAPGVHSGENFAGAGGPMQFLQPTFDAVVRKHPIPPGGADPPSRYNPHDAIHAAAAYLCDNGARDGRDLRAAIYAYNHANWYVDKILTQAQTYRTTTPAAAPGQLRTDWPPQQATMPDPTSNGPITPRTLALVHALKVADMTGTGLGCYAHRPANPTSDHPKGRACDIMFNPHDPASVADGWRVANWLTTRQATLAVRYLIWHGQYWSADNPTWRPYHSRPYGCPNPTNLTGCHYDHVHISIY